MSKMGVKKLGLFLLVLFFFSSSLCPSQHPLVSASNLEIRGRENVVNRRGGGGGGHGGGGGGHSGGRGGGGGHSGSRDLGHSEGSGSDGGRGGGGGHSGSRDLGHSEGSGSDAKAKGLAVAGVVPLYATGALNHQNHNNDNKPQHRSSNGCTTNYFGLPQFVFPLLGVSLSLSYLLFSFRVV